MTGTLGNHTLRLFHPNPCDRTDSMLAAAVGRQGRHEYGSACVNPILFRMPVSVTECIFGTVHHFRVERLEPVQTFMEYPFGS